MHEGVYEMPPPLNCYHGVILTHLPNLRFARSSQTSAVTQSRSGQRLAARPASRVAHRTTAPDATSAGYTARPTKPVAPVSKTLRTGATIPTSSVCFLSQ